MCVDLLTYPKLEHANQLGAVKDCNVGSQLKFVTPGRRRGLVNHLKSRASASLSILVTHALCCGACDVQPVLVARYHFLETCHQAHESSHVTDRPAAEVDRYRCLFTLKRFAQLQQWAGSGRSLRDACKQGRQPTQPTRLVQGSPPTTSLPESSLLAVGEETSELPLPAIPLAHT